MTTNKNSPTTHKHPLRPQPEQGKRPFIPPPMMDTSAITRKWLDRSYANQSPAQKLDIYLPETSNGPFPVIVSIHGGAWMFGDKGDAMNLPAMQGLRRGYAVISMNYRLSGEAIFPCPVYDCKAAIRYIRANAPAYFLDPDRIAVWGASAGAHLAAFLGASSNGRKIEDFSMGNPLVSSKVQAVVDWCGPAEDFLKMDEELIESGLGVADHSEEASPESRLLGARITKVPDLVRRASPMTYLSALVPPFLIQHGNQDPIVPVQQSIKFAAEIEKKAGAGRVILEVLPGVGHHGDPAFETEANVQRVLDFIDSCLKK